MDIIGYIIGHMRPIKPSQLFLTTEILNLVSEIDEFKGRWTATQILAPDRLTQLLQVATIESVGSSTRIEGVKLTNTQIEALLRGVKTFSFRSRDEQEVAGYSELLEMIFTSYPEITLTENTVKQAHGVLLKYSSKDERHRGDYKKFQNNVEAFSAEGKSQGIIFETASPFKTPTLMKELLDWTQSELSRKELHSLLIIAIFIVVFLAIHPFQDGNGRLSRALTTLLLLRAGYAYVPYSSLERVIEESKQSYYLALQKAQKELEFRRKPKGSPTRAAQGIEEWIEFFLKALKKQKMALEMKLKDELTIQSLASLSISLLELIKSRGPTSVSEATAAIGANRNTIKLHFQNLLKDGYLISQGKGRGTRYRLKILT